MAVFDEFGPTTATTYSFGTNATTATTATTFDPEALRRYMDQDIVATVDTPMPAFVDPVTLNPEDVVRSDTERKYILKNGIIVKKNPDDSIEVLSVPSHYNGGWRVGDHKWLLRNNGELWLGGTYGPDYDMIRRTFLNVGKKRDKTGLYGLDLNTGISK